MTDDGSGLFTVKSLYGKRADRSVGLGFVDGQCM